MAETLNFFVRLLANGDDLIYFCQTEQKIQCVEKYLVADSTSSPGSLFFPSLVGKE